MSGHELSPTADCPYADSAEQLVPRGTSGITIYECDPDEAVLFRDAASRCGVVSTITGAAVSETTAELASGNLCISVGHKTKVARSTLAALSMNGVRYLSTRSVGFDHIDTEYAASVGITVGTVTYSPDSVADYTLMLMLMTVRDAKSTVDRANRHDYRLTDSRGRELRDLTVGVVGTGRIGTAVMDRLRGFGSRVVAYDSRPMTSADYVPLDELLQVSDIVTLHAPLDASTHHLLDRENLARMKPGAIVVNTGRGGLIDTDALASALENGYLGGAALDVIEGEEGIFYADCRDRPLENKPFARLERLPNVFISPHTAYYTNHTLYDIVENSLINCLNFVNGNQHV